MLHFLTKAVLAACLLLLPHLPAVAQQKEIIVEVNKNIEVLCALNNQLSAAFLRDSVADPFLYTSTRLMRLNYEHFLPYQKHPAVEATQHLSDKIGTGVYLLGLFYEELPRVKQKQPVSEVILREIHPHPDTAAQVVQAYMQLVAQFYQDTRFDRYLRQNQPTYQLAIQEVRKSLPGRAFLPTLENYYGASKGSYHLVVMPFFKSGWGLSWQVEDHGKTHLYNIAAPMQEQVLDRNKRTLAAGYDNPTEIRNLSVHEFGHSFVNPLTTQPPLEAQINQYAHLFKPIPHQPQYTDWLTSFNEHLVRAGEIRIALQMGTAQGAQALQTSYRDWMYLPHFLQQLSRYERNRIQYPTLASFLPDLVASLSALGQK
ncbi:MULTISPECIES: DUF4932 domain-containing protein [Rufibacter]|uniref:DUF4932 domain-containing protein n=1 Tax=Rufibacter quisquiliarum TaxID=1549639 RepID=A0A839GLQ0_9BACT|nr:MULTISPECIES: DUF4932 domain-containing protein [Rufibacter]MBA9079630.1 hypothetical protein [Rufibacter quisquiliarum]